MDEPDTTSRGGCLASSRLWAFRFGTAEPTNAERDHLERCVRCLALFEAIKNAEPPSGDRATEG